MADDDAAVEELALAIERGDHSKLRWIMNRKKTRSAFIVDPNTPYPGFDRMNSVGYAVSKSKIQMAIILIDEFGADPNSIDSRGRVALCYCKQDHEVLSLLSRGADPFVRVDVQNVYLTADGYDYSESKWLYPINCILCFGHVSAAVALVEKIERLPRELPPAGILSCIDEPLAALWPVVKKLCDLGCPDAPDYDGLTLLYKAVDYNTHRAGSYASVRFVDYLCEKQTYPEGGGPDAVVSAETQETLIEFAGREGLMAQFFSMLRITKNRDIVRRIEQEFLAQTDAETFVPVQGDDSIVVSVKRAFNKCFFEFEDAGYARRALESAERIPGLGSEAVIEEAGVAAMTVRGLTSPKMSMWKLLLDLSRFDFSTVKISSIIKADPNIEYEKFESMLLIDRGMSRSEYPGQEKMRLGPVVGADVKEIIKRGRTDLVFLLLKYKKIQPFTLEPVSGGHLVLSTTDIVAEGLEIGNEKISVSTSEYGFRHDYISDAYRVSELFLRNNETVDSFQLLFSMIEINRQPPPPARTTEADTLAKASQTLPPSIISLVSQYIMQAPKKH